MSEKIELPPLTPRVQEVTSKPPATIKRTFRVQGPITVGDLTEILKNYTEETEIKDITILLYEVYLTTKS